MNSSRMVGMEEHKQLLETLLLPEFASFVSEMRNQQLETMIKQGTSTENQHFDEAIKESNDFMKKSAEILINPTISDEEREIIIQSVYLFLSNPRLNYQNQIEDLNSAMKNIDTSNRKLELSKYFSQLNNIIEATEKNNRAESPRQQFIDKLEKGEPINKGLLTGYGMAAIGVIGSIATFAATIYFTGIATALLTTIPGGMSATATAAATAVSFGGVIMTGLAGVVSLGIVPLAIGVVGAGIIAGFKIYDKIQESEMHKKGQLTNDEIREINLEHFQHAADKIDDICKSITEYKNNHPLITRNTQKIDQEKSPDNDKIFERKKSSSYVYKDANGKIRMQAPSAKHEASISTDVKKTHEARAVRTEDTELQRKSTSSVHKKFGG